MGISLKVLGDTILRTILGDTTIFNMIIWNLEHVRGYALTAG
ncbi:hypothetical protein EMIT079MI2_210052 [Bacillus sp. IT-79MI2]